MTAPARTAPPAEAAAPPEIALLLDVLALVLTPGSAAFVSGPLASGPRLYAAPAADPAEVRRRNAREMEDFAAGLRARLGKPVISPAGLQVAGWRGRTYGELFRRVIERFAAEVWFLDGWELSTGSVGELATCWRLRLPAYDQRGAPLDRETALARCREALVVAVPSGVDCASLREAVRRLAETAGDGGDETAAEGRWNG